MRLSTISLLALAASPALAELVAGWDFQTTANGGTAIAAAPSTPKVFVANFGAGSLFLNGTEGSSDWTSATTNTELTSFAGTATINLGTGFSTSTSLGSLALVGGTSSGTPAVLSANTKKVTFRFSMANRENLVVSYATQKTSTGFSSQLWEYSTDGSTWTTAETVTSIASSFAAVTLAPIPGLNNTPTAYLRLTLDGATTSTGNNRLDNIQLNADLSAGTSTISLAFSPDNASETAGASATTGTLTLSAPAPAGGLAVALTSSDADQSEITLPASVTVAAGATTATFTVGTKTDGVFDGPQPVSITAAAANYASGSATFTVNDSDAGPSLVITELFDAIGTGSTLPDMNGNGVSGFDDAYLEITNTGSTAADLSGYTVKSLGTGTTAAIRHTFPAGTTLAPGAILLLFQDFSTATPPNPAFTGFATLADATSSLIFGDSADTVTLNTASGATVSTFAYSAGAPGVALVRETDNSIVVHAQATTANGLAYSPGRRTNGTASPVVTQSGFFFYPTTATTILEKVDALSGYPNTCTFGVVRVGPDALAPVTISLTSSDTANATVPASVTIPAGQYTATFDVTGVTDNAQDPASVKVGSLWTTPVTVTGTLGAGTYTGKVDVIDFERLNLLVPTIAPVLSSIAEGDTVGTTLTISLPGTETVDRTFTVTATANGTQVTLANGGVVTVAANQLSADLGVVAVDDADVDGPKVVTFVTSASGYEPATTTLTVTDNDVLGYIPLNGSGTYTQNFNTLPSSGTTNTWTDDSTMPGWYAQRTGNGTSILVDTGAGNAGGLYSFGPAGNTDRALGSLGSSNAAAGHFAYGVQFKNTSAAPITLGNLSYVGEQWRNAVTAAQTATLWYQIGTASITALTPNVNTGWTALTAGDFTGPVTTGTIGAIDGNAAANRTAISFAPGLTLAPGEYIVFRWSDPDQTGSDHGLAIDDFALTYSGSGGTETYASWATGVFGANATEPTIGGINADPDGDGVVNLLEFALGTSPVYANEARRVISTKTPTGYTLSYTAPTVPLSGVAYILEAAPAPAGPWVPQTSGFTTSLQNNGNGTSTVTLTRPFNGTAEYLRLRISIP